jgi:hypothetical protein
MKNMVSHEKYGRTGSQAYECTPALESESDQILRIEIAEGGDSGGACVFEYRRPQGTRLAKSDTPLSGSMATCS